MDNHISYVTATSSSIVHSISTATREPGENCLAFSRHFQGFQKFFKVFFVWKKQCIKVFHHYLFWNVVSNEHIRACEKDLGKDGHKNRHAHPSVSFGILYACFHWSTQQAPALYFSLTHPWNKEQCQKLTIRLILTQNTSSI